MEASPPPPAPQTPPPGWYADPQAVGRQRYWDGTAWTENVSPGHQSPTQGGDPKQWAMVAHLSALAGLVIGLNFLGPLIIYLIKKDEDPYVREQAAEALNFNLSVLIYAVVAGVVTVVLVFVLIGVLLIPLFAVAVVGWIVLVVVAAIKASNGEPYRYPLTIRFVS
jgi:uncharacterized Tic20 family protein